MQYYQYWPVIAFSSSADGRFHHMVPPPGLKVVDRNSGYIFYSSQTPIVMLWTNKPNYATRRQAPLGAPTHCPTPIVVSTIVQGLGLRLSATLTHLLHGFCQRHGTRDARICNRIAI